MLNALGHNQAAGSELLLPVPEQAERADDPEANNPLLPEPKQAAGADDPEPNNPPDIDVKVEEKVKAAIERIFQSEIGKGNFRKDNCAF